MNPREERGLIIAALCKLNRTNDGWLVPSQTGGGRKPHSVRDSVYAMVLKVYSTFSSRRFSSDLREAKNRGYINRVMPGLKVPTFFQNPELTPILKSLIVQSSLPLRVVETDFA